MENGFMGKLTEVLGNFATKVNSFRYIMVIKNAFASLIQLSLPERLGPCSQRWYLTMKMV